jgi:hypothetical protein
MLVDGSQSDGEEGNKVCADSLFSLRRGTTLY